MNKKILIFFSLGKKLFFRPQKKLTLPLFRWGLTGSGSTLADFGAHIHITNFLHPFISVLVTPLTFNPLYKQMSEQSGTIGWIRKVSKKKVTFLERFLLMRFIKGTV